MNEVITLCRDELAEAREEIDQAYQNLNYAEQSHVDIAIMQLNLAIKRAEVATGKASRLLPWLRREAV